MNTDQILTLARDMQSSARLCLADAIALRDKGDLINAQVRAVKSLAYSVGVFHDDYKKANQACAKNWKRLSAAIC